MTKKTIILLSIVGAALLGAGLWYYFAHKNTQEYTLETINPAYGYIDKSNCLLKASSVNLNISWQSISYKQRKPM